MESSTEQLTGGAIALRLAGVLLLVLANAFFVAAEFALVSVRRSRIDSLAAQGNRSARIVQKTVDDVNYFISAAQLGITMASLGLGWIGEATMASLVDRGLSAVGIEAAPGVAHTLAAVITAYFVITFLHVVLGEQAPKTVALVSAERVALLVVRPLRLFATATRPFTWLLNASSNGLIRILGLQPVNENAHIHSPEELRMLVMQTHAHGLLDASDSAMLAGVFDFHNKRARDVMRPRTEVVALASDAPEEEVWKVVRQERYSRYPVYGEDLDDLVGVFLAKDLWLHDGTAPFSLSQFVREPLYVPDTRPAERVFDDLRKTRAQMAIVLDEYGGTAGIVTMEDLVEEIVGDIADEYDVAAREAMEVNGVLELAGSMSLVDVRSDHSIAVPEGSWSTLGGYVFSKLGRIPKVGDRATFPGGEFEVVAMDSRRVAAVRVHRLPLTADADR
ncbi:MAG: hemolysin family protein [Gemmatimonadaceae bacterium]